MKLKDLKPSYTELSPEETLILVRRLRESRRTPKKKVRKKTIKLGKQGATAKRKVKAPDLTSMSGNDLNKLISKLEGIMND